MLNTNKIEPAFISLDNLLDPCINPIKNDYSMFNFPLNRNQYTRVDYERTNTHDPIDNTTTNYS